MPLIFQSRIYRADPKANPNVIYCFGDNERRVGLGGQAAEMRGEPNALGVATLAAPHVFWTDADADRQNAIIDADMRPIFKALRDGRAVVFPLDGIGSGLADLERRSPLTWRHLQHRIQQMKGYANG